MASPIPIEAPVTTTTFPLSSMLALYSAQPMKSRCCRHNVVESKCRVLIARWRLRGASSPVPARIGSAPRHSLAASHFRTALQGNDPRVHLRGGALRRGARFRRGHRRSRMHRRNHYRDEGIPRRSHGPDLRRTQAFRSDRSESRSFIPAGRGADRPG